MAKRRMFSQRIVGSAKFLRMPTEPQELYFHLGVYADDDGIVEAYNVLSLTGRKEKELRALEDKGFVKILNDDLVTYIVDWLENNNLRPDRKVDSIYIDLLAEKFPDAKVLERKPKKDVKKKDGQPNANQMTTKCQPNANQMTTKCQPNANQMTTKCQPNDGLGEDRLGKDRLGKDRLGQESESNTPSLAQENPSGDSYPALSGSHTYGLYNNVILTDEEFSALALDYPHEYKDMIENLSAYMKSHGKSYADHYATLCDWKRKDDAKKYQKPINKTAQELDDFYEWAQNWAEGD